MREAQITLIVLGILALVNAFTLTVLKCVSIGVYGQLAISAFMALLHFIVAAILIGMARRIQIREREEMNS